MKCLIIKFLTIKFLIICFAMCLLLTSASAQEPVGGPYVADENTVLLLHFDDDLSNAASTGGTATANGTVSFVDGRSGMGKAVFLDNGTVPANFLSFDHIPELELLGDLTIEGWFKYADTTLVEENDPSYLVSKPAHNSLGRFNYAVISNFNGTNVQATYVVDGPGSSIPQNAGAGGRAATASFVDSQGQPLPDQLGGQWLHFTYQRSTELRVISMAIHDENGELLYFAFRQTHPTWDPPFASSLALLLGRQSLSRSRDGYFHGYLDEIRISNTLRHMDLPPVILYQHYLREPFYSRKIGNQLDTQADYPFSLNIAVLGAESGVQDASIFYRLVGDPYEKVAADDPSWMQVAMTNSSGSEWTGAIPQQPLGSVIQHYHSATSSTGLNTTFGANADSSYDSFGVMKERDIVLKLSFEETDLNFIDSSGYNHELRKLGFWSLNDDEDVPEGEIAAHLIEGNNAFGEIVSPFLSLEEYTITVWVNVDSFRHNTYVISNVPGANFGDSYVDDVGIGPFAAGDVFRPTYTLILRNPNGDGRVSDAGNDVFLEELTRDIAWSYERTRTPLQAVGIWSHWMINLGPDSVVVQVNDQDDVPFHRTVMHRDSLFSDVDKIIPYAPSISKFRIGPPSVGSGQPFYWGKLDELVVYNYQTFPGNFAMAPIPTDVGNDRPAIPERYQLSKNFPNPFNPGTTIHFTVPSHQEATLEIYDVLGKRVKTLLQGKVAAGDHTITWDGTTDSGQAVASGIYFYKLKTKGYSKTMKMTLIR